MQHIHVTDMHTAGEPVRIITDGYPALPGKTLLAKRRSAKDQHDQLRELLMLEPRGHSEMYGAIPMPPVHPDADLSVLFMHNSGYSTMCGHATIAIARWAIDTGHIAATEGETRFTLECPCGLVDVVAEMENGTVKRARFDSVASYVALENVMVDVPGFGDVKCDIAYGGAYYAIVPASRFGLHLHKSPLEDLRRAAVALTNTLRETQTLEHPVEADLGFLYGSILSEGPVVNRGAINHHLCFFADGQLDRSPTGSGVTARLALAHQREEIAPGQKCCFKGISGVSFGGMIKDRTKLGDFPAVTVQVTGSAFYTGESRFMLEPTDPLQHGFLAPKHPKQHW